MPWDRHTGIPGTLEENVGFIPESQEAPEVEQRDYSAQIIPTSDEGKS